VTLGPAVPGPASRSLDLVALGEGGIDTMVPIAQWPGPDEKHRAGRLAEQAGGQAAVVAVGCARLGLRAAYAGAVGDDVRGQRLGEALATEGVAARVVVRTAVPTRSAVILVGGDGRRTVIEHRDPGLRLNPSEVDEQLVGSARVLMLDVVDPEASQAALLAARQAGVATIVDADRPGADVVEILREVDLVVLPASTVVDLAGSDDIGEALRRLDADLRPALAVATLGPEGSLARYGGREIRTRAPAVDVVDTTGAGDAFRAGLVAAWIGPQAQPDVDSILTAANAVGALNCRALGALAGLPGPAELARYL
jgi:sulfofructose kinase